MTLCASGGFGKFLSRAVPVSDRRPGSVLSERKGFELPSGAVSHPK